MSQLSPYDQKLTDAQGLLEAYNLRAVQHNKDCDPSDPEDKPMAIIEVKKFFRALARRGAIDLDSLSRLSWETIRDCGVTPEITAQSIAAIFRAPTTISGSQSAAPPTPSGSGHHSPHITHVISVTEEQRVAGLPLEEIVRNYDPHDPDGLYAMALLRKVRAARCVVFNSNGKVNVDATTALVTEIVGRQPPRESWVNPATGEVHRTYRLGELPPEHDLVQVCTLHNCQIRDDGECVDGRESLVNVSDAALHLFGIGRRTRDPVITAMLDNPLELRRMLETLRGQDEAAVVKTFSGLSQPLILAYRDEKAADRLPKLKVPRAELEDSNAAPLGGGRGSPFGGSGGGSSAPPPAEGRECPVVYLRPGVLHDGGKMAGLRTILESLVKTPASVQMIQTEANIPEARIDFSGPIQIVWFHVLEEAKKHTRGVETVLGIVLRDYPSAWPTIMPFLVAEAPALEPITAGRDPAWPRDRVIHLRKTLAELYKDSRVSALRMLGNDAKVNMTACPFPGSAEDVAEHIVREANKASLLHKVLQIAKEDYPDYMRTAGF